ncbi:hypothetical protein MKW98_028120 [Papaver atlanticum]|uniref:Uncharacterized protein n=1 Tax=Papaver atlanticum TaxID=357466 RepID=A0AAD4SYU5_9MAGN|nr:hypothetical protein MKW98_028120 [Papaver atlanticum]
MDTIRILVVEGRRTGKSTLLEHLNGQFHGNANVCTIDFVTNEDRNVRFLCSESLDDNGENSIYDGYLVIFDLTNTESYKHSKRICRDLTARLVNKQPIVLVGNKKDCPQKVDVAADRVYQVPKYYISAKNNEDIEKPFLCLAKLILKSPSLMFIHDVPVAANAGDNVVQADEGVAHAEVAEGPSVDHEVIMSANANEEEVAQAPSADDIKIYTPAKSRSPCPRSSRTIRIHDDGLDLEEFLRGQGPSRCFY